MPPVSEVQHFLPSREISYAYTVAMHFAQQLELDLRAILFTADYHGWIPDLPVSEEERQRSKNADQFIDKAACGSLIRALRESTTGGDEGIWVAFERACALRNRLAHSFLSEHDFDHLTDAQEQSILRQLYSFAGDLRDAVRVSRGFRAHVEKLSARDLNIMQKSLDDIGVPGIRAPKPIYVHPRKRRGKNV
jgi:hypothetical protein